MAKTRAPQKTQAKARHQNAESLEPLLQQQQKAGSVGAVGGEPASQPESRHGVRAPSPDYNPGGS